MAVVRCSMKECESNDGYWNCKRPHVVIGMMAVTSEPGIRFACADLKRVPPKQRKVREAEDETQCHF